MHEVSLDQGHAGMCEADSCEQSSELQLVGTSSLAKFFICFMKAAQSLVSGADPSICEIQ